MRVQPGPSTRTDPPHYGLDIETDTTIDGLDPTRSAVIAVAVATEHRDHVLLGEEADILRRLDHLMDSLPPGIVVTWNGSRFDLPFLAERARLLGVPLSLCTYRRGRPGDSEPGDSDLERADWVARWGLHLHLDGYRLYRQDVGRTLGLSCGLKAVSRLVGLVPVEVDRTAVHQLDPEELARYVASDAQLARELVSRRLPAANTHADRVPGGGRSPRSGAVVTGRN
jgi:DNA polymerase elongation subunit (family B)